MYTCSGLILLFLIQLVYVTCQILHLNEGEICNGSGTKAWKCEFIKNCPQIGDFRTNRPTICRFEGIDPIICCPPPPQVPAVNNTNTNNSNRNGLVSNGNAEKNCNVYSNFICNLHTRLRRQSNNTVEVEKDDGESKVFGGRNAASRQHRNMVWVGYGPSNAKSWECGGSLISERWVLTAAHCAHPETQGPARWARVGDLDVSSTTDDARPQEKLIVDRIIHPEYKRPAVYNDIALLKLDSAVVFNDWVAPVCLQTQTTITVNKAIITGWGRLGFVADVSPHLQEVEISLVSPQDCRRLHANFTNGYIPRGIDPNRMVCAGEREGGKDACSGDSGGPMVVNLAGRCVKTQIGITSFGRECGLPDSPGVYTRVSYYIPWIESIVWPI